MSASKRTIIDEVKRRIKKAVDAGYLVRVGRPEAPHIGCSIQALHVAVHELKENEGYQSFYVPKQYKSGKTVNILVISNKNATYGYVLGKKNEFVHLAAAEKAMEESHKPHKEKDKKRTSKEIEEMVFNVRQLKRKGMSNVAIAKEYNLSESTIRRHLKKPLTSKEKLIDTMLKAVESGQNHIFSEVVQTQEFLDVFGFDYGPGYYMVQKNDLINVAFHAMDDEMDSMTFNIRFSMKKVKDNR